MPKLVRMFVVRKFRNLSMVQKKTQFFPAFSRHTPAGELKIHIFICEMFGVQLHGLDNCMSMTIGNSLRFCFANGNGGDDANTGTYDCC